MQENRFVFLPLSIYYFHFVGKTLLDEQDWYEKDLSDFDDPQLSDEEHEG